jgi:hypothetical protein
VTVRTVVLSALLAVLMSGCEPTCRETCRKLLDCDDVDTPRLSLEECESTCENEQDLYELWEDEGKRDAMGEMKRCIADEDCGAIADGVCYDPDLVIW